ncbi:MAG: haloacid dehalogenase-like hydrolase [Nanoarchaeota archaeon]|nr:haloacid dehalogenase-like hydrolase [Nanoarchaeota archaeon]
MISDFDRTLTKSFVNGEEIPSLISVLRSGKYLTKDYPQKANDLRSKYYPIEINPDISPEEKKEAMNKWWTAHFDLLIKSKLNKKDIEKVVKSEKVKFREGTSKFLDFLHNYDIPLVILSSAGLGMESIQVYLENKKRLYNNIHIVSNSFKWDKEGYIISVNEPIITSMNKDETEIKKFSFYNHIKNRKNVLLFGDSLGDIGMIKGFDCKNIIKIGFLNNEIEKNIEKYKENYDVVILNDGDMDYVNELLRRLIKD